MIFDRIVVIDDDPKISYSLKMIFKEYEIIDFQDGQKALEFLRRPNEISLVLLDILMKGMNGLDVLKEIRKVNKRIAIIMMTAFGSKDVIVESLRGHADDFIEKPFDVKELREKIKDILKERSYFQGFNRNNKVERIKRFIEENYDNVSLEALADEMCLSPKYMSRLFKEKSEFGFRNYKVKVKMDAAKQLLESSSFTISQISDKLGYQNPESFMRLFKRMINLTPTQYRKKFQRPNSKLIR